MTAPASLWSPARCPRCSLRSLLRPSWLSATKRRCYSGTTPKFNYLSQDVQSCSSDAGIISTAPRATFEAPRRVHAGVRRPRVQSLPSIRSNSTATAAVQDEAASLPSFSPEPVEISTSKPGAVQDLSPPKAASDESQAPKLRPQHQKDWSPNFKATKRRLENITGYQFNDPDFVKIALYTGNVRVGRDHIPQPQQQLAIIGDAIYKVAYYATSFPSTVPGVSNRNFPRIASNVHLARVGRRRGLIDIALDFEDFRSLLGKTRTLSFRVEGTITEAIIGAIYLDSGNSLSEVQKLLYRWDAFTPSVFMETKQSEAPSARGRAHIVTRPLQSSTEAPASTKSHTQVATKTLSSPSMADLHKSLYASIPTQSPSPSPPPKQNPARQARERKRQRGRRKSKAKSASVSTSTSASATAMPKSILELASMIISKSGPKVDDKEAKQIDNAVTKQDALDTTDSQSGKHEKSGTGQITPDSILASYHL